MALRRTTRLLFSLYNQLGSLLFLVVIADLFLPLTVQAQDSIPIRFKIPAGPGANQQFQITINPEIEHLKRSLSRPIKDADDATELLQKAKTLNYIPAQVVALCDLAAIDEEDKPDASAADLQEAQRIASQIKEIPEAGWAMHEIGKLNHDSPNKSVKFKSNLATVVKALGQAMQNGSVVFRKKDKPKTNDEDGDADVTVDKFKMMPGQEMNFQMSGSKDDRGKPPHFSRHDFSDHWLDSVIIAGHNNPVQSIKLLTQKKARDSSKALSVTFAIKGDYAKALQYFKTYTAYKDSLNAEVSNRRLATLQYNQKLQKKEAEIKLLTKDRELKAQAASRTLYLMFSMFACIAALVAILLILGRNNRIRKRINEELSVQKEELQLTLGELKNTQTQLVHAEKMASLGELTAGIAHEIQNPLNFVNNFSDLSTELVQELIANRKMPQPDTMLELELLEDVELNLQKISQHGKRASGIIKGMLEHSRAGSSEKQQTDLDGLIEEYLKLAYHGIRARDKSFEVKLVTDLKIGDGTINIVPQEIGRVLLNLFNNAFYAVQQREKTGEADYHPKVIVKSARENGRFVIKVKDNGHGIPEQIKQKIFQPFFTTKPTGEGTGLGLSLSYDIITKGHGGELLVSSEVSNFTEITVVLPG